MLHVEQMKAYYADREKAGRSGMTELGECTEADLDRLLNEATLKGGAGSVAVGFYRSEKDFIEIDYVGREQFLIQSDRLFPPTSVWRIFRTPRRLSTTITGAEKTKSFIQQYFRSDRKAFEALFN
jgi:hypothetical protein